MSAERARDLVGADSGQDREGAGATNGETIMKGLETTFDVVVALTRRVAQRRLGK